MRGEILDLKNNTMNQLNSFACEVTRVAREMGTEGKLGAGDLTRARRHRDRIRSCLAAIAHSRFGKKYRIEWATGLTHRRLHRDGVARNELITPSIKRVGLHSPLFARRTIFLATDVAMGASRSATFNRFKASSKAAVMAAVSSWPNAVLISRRVIGISVTYRCESEKLPGLPTAFGILTYHYCHELEMNAV